MPHLVLGGHVDLAGASESLPREVHRLGRAVVKTEDCWLRFDGAALLVEGVVVEFSRPLHPVAMVSVHHDDTMVRLWARADVERTEPVQQWLCILASNLQNLGAGPLKTTNIPKNLWSDLGLSVIARE
jgi:hypothetical protein